MKNYINKFRIVKRTLIVCLMLIAVSCKKEYKDPNGALSADVLASARGLTGVAVGLQKLYAAGRASVYFSAVEANGFLTNELLLSNSGNIPELQFFTGGSSVDGTNTTLGFLWSSSNKIIFDADNVINGAMNLPDKSYASGLIAYTSIFKALAIGNLSEYWEKIPSGIGKNVSFITRAEGYNKAIAVIDNALGVLGANPPSASFASNVPGGINIQNTLYALKARYALFVGNYSLAMTAANQVDLTKYSTFDYDALTPNPIYDIATSTNNVFQPSNANLGLGGAYIPDPADKRLAFYTVPAATAPFARLKGFWTATTVSIPVYLPGEITLIKAEVYARQPDLDNAKTELNKVLTRKPADDTRFGLGADLPALTATYTQSELLTMIYQNRCIELFMSGLKLEDMRRFNLPLTDRKRNFLPYPFAERDNNTNTPTDPTF